LTTTAGPEIYGKQLQLLKDAFPRIFAAHALGLQRHVMEIRNPGDFDNAFPAMTKARVNAIFIPADSMFCQYRARLVRLTANTRLPAMWGLRDQAEAGALMAYSSDLNDLARRAAKYVDKISKGAKPADLPVEQLTKLQLVINLKTAKALDLTILQMLR